MDPGRLSELIGQSRAATVLRNAIRRRRVAHAYLFRGPQGVGKSTAALLFAQALNCDDEARETTGEPCGQCRSCRLIAAGSHPDVWLVTLADDSRGRRRTEISIHQIRRDPKNTKEAVRPIVQDAVLRPVIGRHKVYLIDPADRMSDEAENAMLKLLEEPPPYAVLVLVAERADALLPTVLSRCQPVSFQLAGTAAVAARLEQTGVEAGTAASLAALSGGKVAWAIAAARRPEVLEVRQALLELCDRMEAMGVAESLRLAEEVKQQARRLAQAREEAADEEDEAAAPGRVSVDRALRAELPWCLDVMALWHRDRLAAAAGAGARHYEGAVRATLLARQQIQRNANIDLALEALAIELLVGGASGQGAGR
jgi:DNA polymerase-3 subunit delta'